MFPKILLQQLYSPNVWQNRFDDNLGLLIVVFGVVVVAIHFVVRAKNPPIKGDH